MKSHSHSEVEFYPAMSHPPAHPSVIAATALLGGIHLAQHEPWHILEIGCAAGHHILPIAETYPDATITAIDIDPHAINEARRLADLAGLTNIEFKCADLATWQAPPESYDIIIAHGVFSWVADSTKSSLLALCQQSLKPHGVAMISYNTQPGWTMRQPLREMTLALQQFHPSRTSADQALAWIESALQTRDDSYANYLLDVVRDTRAKGNQQLKFDDLAPINDPCYFSQFIQWIEQAGLNYIGEADSSLPQHALLSATEQPSWQDMRQHPLLAEQMADFLTGRTFRCSVIARRDAPRRQATQDELLSLHVESLMDLPHTGNVATDALAQAINKAGSNCLSIRELASQISDISLTDAIAIAMRLLQLGVIRLRLHPVCIADEMPSHPQLSRLNREHIAQGKPIVDALHRPCLLSENDRAWLKRCDGRQRFEALMQSCTTDEQRAALHAMLAHMQQRGLFLD